MAKKKPYVSGELPLDEEPETTEDSPPESGRTNWSDHEFQNGFEAFCAWVFAYYSFRELKNLNKNFRLSHAYANFHSYASSLVAANAIWLIFDWTCLGFNIAYCFYEERVFFDLPVFKWFGTHAMGIGPNLGLAIWTFVKAWGRSILALEGMIQIYKHLRPAAEQLRKR